MKRVLLFLTLVASNASAQERCVIHYEGPMLVNRMKVDIQSHSTLVPSVSITAEGSESCCTRGWGLASQAVDAAFLTAIRAIDRPPVQFPLDCPQGRAYRVTWKDSWVVFIVDLPRGGMNAFYIPREYVGMEPKPGVLYGYIETLPYGRHAFHDTVNGVTSYDDPEHATNTAFPNRLHY